MTVQKHLATDCYSAAQCSELKNALNDLCLVGGATTSDVKN
jgi:hypothetical protein